MVGFQYSCYFLMKSCATTQFVKIRLYIYNTYFVGFVAMTPIYASFVIKTTSTTSTTITSALESTNGFKPQ